jgi:hypothetical protein
VRSSSERGVHPGDLLIPLAPEMPVLLVRPDLVGSMVSASFLALRPHEDLGLWIWGVLSSRTGRAARAYVAASASSRTSSRSALLELQVPLPPARQDLALSLEEHLARIELHTHRPEEEATETWWRITDLRGGDWRLQLATPTPSALDDGVPLSDLCAEIVRGRPVPKEAISSRPAQDLLLVTDISVIGGKPPSRWVSLGPRLPTIAHPGDVLVAAVGTRPHAFMVREVTAVDRNLWMLRLRNAEHAPGLVRYLNSETGYGVRQLLLTGAFIPGLRKDNLSVLPVPPAALDSPGWDEPFVPLDIQLEQALWS